jgi:hypothetical protein
MNLEISKWIPVQFLALTVSGSNGSPMSPGQRGCHPSDIAFTTQGFSQSKVAALLCCGNTQPTHTSGGCSQIPTFFHHSTKYFLGTKD